MWFNFWAGGFFCGVIVSTCCAAACRAVATAVVGDGIVVYACLSAMVAVVIVWFWLWQLAHRTFAAVSANDSAE